MMTTNESNITSTKSLQANNFNSSAQLISSAEDQFPINYYFPFYFVYCQFSNELGLLECFDTAIKKITLAENKTNVAIIVGESHLLSLLPGIAASKIDLVFIVDINPALHLHIKHLLNSLEKSNDRREFLDYYRKNLPEKCKQFFDIAISRELETLGLENLRDAFLKNNNIYYFLNSENRYQICKESLKKIKFCNIDLNLFNTKECYQMMSLLKKNNANVAFANLNNVENFDHDYRLNVTIPVLLHGSNNPIIINSRTRDNLLCNQISCGTNQYLDRVIKQDDFPHYTNEEIKNFKKLENNLSSIKQFISENKPKTDITLINTCLEIINKFNDTALGRYVKYPKPLLPKNEVEVAVTTITNFIAENLELSKYKSVLMVQSIFRAKQAQHNAASSPLFTIGR